MGTPAADWLQVVEREYLARFVPGGGSAVKFLVGSDIDLAEAESGLERLAGGKGMLLPRIDAATTKIHLIQNIFFEVARIIDWEDLAQRWVEARFEENRYSWPRPGQKVPLRELAEHNDVAEALLKRGITEWLSRDIYRDPQMAQDFRSAMVHLCLSRMEPDDPFSSPCRLDRHAW